MAESNAVWRKIIIALVPMALAAGAGLVALRSDVQYVKQEIESSGLRLERLSETKANKEVMETQYKAILRELEQINKRLDQW